MPHLNATETARRLDVSFRDLRKLTACGVLVGERVGAVTIFDADQVDKIADRDEIHPNDPPTAIAVRMAAPQELKKKDPYWRERKWIGWDQAWDETRKREACRGWWKIAPAFRQAQRLDHDRGRYALIVLVGPVVVASYAIKGDDTPTGVPGGVARLHIDSLDPDPYFEKLLRIGPGPISTPV